MQRLLLVIPVLVLACGDSGVVGDSAPSSGGIATPEVVGETAPSSEVTVTHTEQGSGPSPAATDVVVVHYHGTFPDGEVFDSSVDRGEPARFPLNRVIPCWTEAVQQMKVGGKAQLVCPPESAYGAQGAGPIPPNSTLHFDVELLGIQ